MSTAVNRRALVKGAAWSVPVIALAAAAPQAAASTTNGTVDVLDFAANTFRIRVSGHFHTFVDVQFLITTDNGEPKIKAKGQGGVILLSTDSTNGKGKQLITVRIPANAEGSSKASYISEFTSEKVIHSAARL